MLPVAYNLFFALLARTFDYPDILRRPTGEVPLAYLGWSVWLLALGIGFLIAWAVAPRR